MRWGEKLFYIFIKNIYSKWFLLLLSFWEVFSHYQSPKISGSVFFILQSLFLREIFNSFVEEREKKNEKQTTNSGVYWWVFFVLWKVTYQQNCSIKSRSPPTNNLIVRIILVCRYNPYPSVVNTEEERWFRGDQMTSRTLKWRREINFKKKKMYSAMFSLLFSWIKLSFPLLWKFGWKIFFSKFIFLLSQFNRDFP